jgi:enoyl-CoA hydratase
MWREASKRAIRIAASIASAANFESHVNEYNSQITTPATGTPEAKLRSERSRALHTFTLSRPQVLNAFDDEMCRRITEDIPRVARNPDIYIVGILSNSPRAFCAGGDVLALTSEAKRDIASAKTYLRNEYALDWLLECFSKPTVSFINGVCMGSGVGLSAYNTHRVAGENYKWAMPEVKIGLFPDVGVASVLARLPWPIGLYLGLTGRAIGRADAQWLGLATHCIASSHFGEIQAALTDAYPVDPILDGLNEKQPVGPLQNDSSLIRDHFSHATLGEIFRSLAKAEAAGSDWAKETLAGLRKSSPIALAITDRHIRAARTLDIRETLIEDYRLAVRCLESNDFHEGVRAALRDKDGAPKWQSARFEDVTPDMVAAYFAPLGDDDLVLPSRSEMQAARV